MSYFLTRWKHKEKGWLTSTMENKPTKEQAEKQLKQDVNYFYDDIQIELVEVTERVIQTVRGSNQR